MSSEVTSVTSAKDIAAIASTAPMEPRAATAEHQAVQASAEQSRQALRAALEDLNQQMSQSEMGIHFSMDERSGRSIITVENAATGKVIRQIPDPAALKVAHNIDQLKGVLLDENL